MVTNFLYKSYSNQIAQLFCTDSQNKTLCEAGIKERLNTYLDNETYPIFLSKLNSGRVYITGIEQIQDYGFRIVLIDIITGERVTAWWTVTYKMPYLGILPAKLLNHQYNIISMNKTFSNENKNDLRITWNPTKPSYGITFVPQQVPGYTPPSGGGGGGGQINVIPNVPDQQTPVNAGFNFGEILSNPIVLIGGGLVLYLLMKDKF